MAVRKSEEKEPKKQTMSSGGEAESAPELENTTVTPNKTTVCPECTNHGASAWSVPRSRPRWRERRSNSAGNPDELRTGAPAHLLTRGRNSAHIHTSTHACVHANIHIHVFTQDTSPQACKHRHTHKRVKHQHTPCTCAHIYGHTSLHTLNMCAHTGMQAHTHMHTHARTHMRTPDTPHLLVHMCTHIQAQCVHTRIHTHTHTHVRAHTDVQNTDTPPSIWLIL